LKTRRRKEEDLVSAEERIGQLESALRRLEDLAEREPKRPHPSRNKGDSPEQHAEKKSRPTDGDLAQTSEASDLSSPAAPQPVTPAESKIQKVSTVPETKAAESKIQKVSTVPETKAVESKIQKVSTVPKMKAAESKIQKVSTVPETKAAESKIQKVSTVPETKAAELEIQKVSTAQRTKAAEPEIQKSSRAHVEEVEEIVSSGESSGSSSGDHGEESSGSSSKDSVASIPTWAPDPFDTTSHHYHSSNSGKDSHYRMSVQVPPSRVQKRTDGLYTDEEKGRLTLEAWRARLRNTCQYTPDRDYSDQHHIAKIRVLQTALTHLKKNTWNLSRLEQLEYRHEHYRILGQQYGIPADLRSVDEVYGKLAEGSQSVGAVPMRSH
jgi:ribosomal protein L30/L7E